MLKVEFEVTTLHIFFLENKMNSWPIKNKKQNGTHNRKIELDSFSTKYHLNIIIQLSFSL